MARLFLSTAALLAILAPSVISQGAKCSTSQLCPEDTPCCSQYGTCGVGAYCLGGCDPASSFSLDSCVPEPVCKSNKWDWDNTDSVMDQQKYLGDSSKADWVSSGQPVVHNGELWLTMNEGSVGTLLKSTTSMWYGKISARMHTSAGKGVVTAFILLGNSKDEIDFEFVGTELTTAQTNFYSLGITNYENGDPINDLTNIHDNFHDYEIDWQPDTITWSIDGQVVRTLDKETTWNETANRYSYPQTPCQVQLSLWPGGLASNGEGTIEWAGGLVTWDDPSMVNGYYYASFDSVEMQCYDPPPGAREDGKKSYVYTDTSMTNASIEITDDDHILKSFLASGIDMDKGDGTDDNKPQTSDVATIPGLTGAGPGSSNNQHDNGTSSSGTDDSGNPMQGTVVATGSGSSATGFVQDPDSDSGAAHIGGNSEHVLQGSLFAVVVAIIGLCVL